MDAPVVGGSGGLFQVCSTVSAFLSLCVRQVGGSAAATGGLTWRKMEVLPIPHPPLPLSLSPFRSDPMRERRREGVRAGGTMGEGRKGRPGAFINFVTRSRGSSAIENIIWNGSQANLANCVAR